MSTKYYTYVSVNKKSIRVEETEQEHEERMSRLRKMERARQIQEHERSIGLHRGVSFICKGCGRMIPSTTQSRTGNFICKFCNYAGPNWTNGPRI